MPEGSRVLAAFLREWPDFVRVELTENVLREAGHFAWTYDLRTNDALHLAAARAWQDLIACPLTFATFDRDLWWAAMREGLVVWPQNLSSYV